MTGGTDTAPWLGASARFATTQWSMVLEAGHGGPDRTAALGRFCQTYWYPLYAFARRQGRSADDARELTQEFFARLVEKDWLAGVERRDTRFSTFLLTIFRRFLINEDLHRRAAKRGAGATLLSIDAAMAEAWFGAEPSTGETPEKTFARRWALAVLASTMDHLREELQQAGKLRHFEVLSPFLSSEPLPGDYETAGRSLELGPRTVAVAVHRLRHRYREILRDELAAGFPDRSRADEELRDLVRALTE